MTHMRSRLYPCFRSARGQAGAVLYIAMIMLVLLALLGIAGMQVSGMQERMSASYRAVNRAFQNAEAYVRATECGLPGDEGSVPAGCTVVSSAEVNPRCDDGYDAGSWVRDRVLAHAPTRNIRRIEACMTGEAEIVMGGTQETGGALFSVYQITVYDSDTADVGGANPSSAAAIETIFKP